MPKQKFYYYETILTVDVIYEGPVHRDDQKVNRYANELMEHSRRFKTGDIPKGLGPDFLVTTRPIAAHFTDEIEKTISRPDPTIGNPRQIRKTYTKIKFILRPYRTATEVPPKCEIVALTLRECDCLGGEVKGKYEVEPEKVKV